MIATTSNRIESWTAIWNSCSDIFSIVLIKSFEQNPIPFKRVLF